MELNEFIEVCNELGLKTKLDKSFKEDGTPIYSCYAYYESNLLVNKYYNEQHIFTWSNEYFSDNSIYEGFMEALWRDWDGEKESYCLNGIDLGDCESPLTSKEQMLKIGKAFIAAIKTLESDKTFRPGCIELTQEGFKVFRQ